MPSYLDRFSHFVYSYFIDPLAEEDDIEAQRPNQQVNSGVNPFHHLYELIVTDENKPGITHASLLTAASIGFNFLAPYLFAETIGNLNNEDEQNNVMGFELSQQAMLSLLCAGYALSQLTPVLRDKVLTSVGANATQTLLKKIPATLLDRPLSYHTKTPNSDKIYILQKAFPVANMATPLLTQVIPTFLELVFASTMISYQYGTGVGLSLSGAFALFTTYNIKSAKQIIDSRAIELDKCNDAWNDIIKSIENYKTIHDCDMRKMTIKKIDASVNAATLSQIQTRSTQLTISGTQTIISNLFSLAALLLLGNGVTLGSISSKDFAGLAAYIINLSMLLPKFGSAVNEVAACQPDLEFVFNELNNGIKEYDPNLNRELALNSANIQFNHIDFHYETDNHEQKVVLEDLNFCIQSGEIVGLVGESGCGKSTLINMLFRYYLPSSGSVMINGENTKDVGLASLRKNIAMIGQKPNLFKGSIRENICSANEDFTDAMIYATAEAVGLSDFLASFESGLDTDVGVDGNALSGGQQQKIAILRGLLKKAPILVLDEITAALDASSAKEVLNGIKQLSREKGTTVIVITHKLAELPHFVDNIAVIEGGSVSDKGTHNELVNKPGLYQSLWSKQQNKVANNKNGFLNNASHDNAQTDFRLEV